MQIFIFVNACTVISCFFKLNRRKRVILQTTVCCYGVFFLVDYHSPLNLLVPVVAVRVG